MKTMLPFFLLWMVAIVATAQQKSYSDLPVTSDSPRALELFNQGVQDLMDVKIQDANENFTNAVELDPEFMMANMMVAMGHYYNKEEAKFKEFANRAIQSKAQVNESEKLMQQALKKLVEDPRADVSQYGEELVSQNPQSFFAHQVLATFQQFANNAEGALKTYEKMLTLTDRPAPVYNSMGYAYMATNQMDKAREAFEKYIKADPENANAYDSMGDYYAKSQEFENARQSYLKAYEMDSVNFMISQKKADQMKEQVAEK